MSEDDWKGPFWHKTAMDHANRGDELVAEGKCDEARSEYTQAARAEESAAKYARDLSRVVLMRSVATLWILAGFPWEAESIAMKELAKNIESGQLRAEFRTIIRDAWKAQGITAKGDRAESDAFVMQRKRVRAGIKRMLAKDGAA